MNVAMGGLCFLLYKNHDGIIVNDWKDILHNKTVTWLSLGDGITGSNFYLFF